MQNSHKRSTRKLSLAKETLRHLDSQELRQVAGGRPKSYARICDDPVPTDIRCQ